MRAIPWPSGQWRARRRTDTGHAGRLRTSYLRSRDSFGYHQDSNLDGDIARAARNAVTFAPDAAAAAWFFYLPAHAATWLVCWWRASVMLIHHLRLLRGGYALLSIDFSSYFWTTL